MTSASGSGHGGLAGRISRDLAAGGLMIAIAVLAWVFSMDLPGGQGPMLGPGSMPRGMAGLLGVCGVIIAVIGLMRHHAMEAWSIRGPVLVLGAVLLFAITIRSLGLMVAAPLALIVASLASPETRLGEIAIFAVAMTAACVGLFRFALGLPIPIAPWAGF